MSTSLPRCLPSLGAATYLLVLHLLAGPAPCQAPAGPTVAVREPLPAVAAEQIRAWVADLESDTYSARHAATERLISIGRPAVKPLADAIERGGLETIIRGIYILRQLALSAEDVQTEQEAYDALQRVAHRKLTTASRRALAAVSAIDEVRRHRAQRRLERLGAVVSVSAVQVGARLTQPFPSIQIDENWTGTPEELRLIEQITTAPGPDNIDQWMIVFAGPQVTDAWIDVIAKDKNVAVLELKNTHVTDRGIERLAESPSLQFLEIKYTPISDRSLPAIASIRRLARLKLYGTRVTPAGIEKFRQQFGGVAVDYRRGGFLGIGCDDNPCRVTTVREGTAAAKAGLQFGDVITKYNGKPVRTMDELTALIAENQVGDAVTIEIDRGGETIVREVVLGAWE